jgi:hypothetical protein
MKFYCVESWSNSPVKNTWTKGKTYNYYITYFGPYDIINYMVDTENSGYQPVTNQLFIQRYFMDNRRLRKQKLKKIYENG